MGNYPSGISDGAILELNVSTGQRTLISSASEGVGTGPSFSAPNAGAKFAAAQVSHSAPAFPGWAMGALSVLLIGSTGWVMATRRR